MMYLEQRDIPRRHAEGLVGTRARLEPVKEGERWLYRLAIEMTGVDQPYLLYTRAHKVRLFRRIEAAVRFVQVWFPEVRTVEIGLPASAARKT